MKNLYKISGIMVLTVLSITAVNAKTVIVTLDNIRNNKGKILVMASLPGVKEPLYQMVEAQEGPVTIELKNINSDTAELSLFHDENGNFKMDMGNRGPIEGYVTKKCKLLDENTKIKLRIFYPDSKI